MTTAEKYLISAGTGYLIGSVNMGIILSKVHYHSDVRNLGSGNAGATNMARTFGAGGGAMTLCGDAMKSMVSMSIGSLIAGKWGKALSGAFCMIGHCWPLYFGFKGGKGVASGAAVALMIDPKVFAAGVAAFAVGVASTRRVSVGSISASLAVSIAARYFRASTPEQLLMFFSTAVVLYEHIPNMKRLASRTEPVFHFGHAPEKESA